MAYFDNAATTLVKPQEVLGAVNSAMLELNVNYGRGQHELSSRAYSLVEETRELVQEVVGAFSKDVVFLPTATEGLNILIRGAKIRRGDGGLTTLEKGDIVYISPLEHNAVTRTLEFLKERRGIEVRVFDFDNYSVQFEEVAPAMVVMTHVSNVTGEVLSVREICSAAKKVTGGKCVTIVDMAQSFGKAICGNIANLETIDAVVFSGHKSLYAPFGASGMLVSRSLQIDPLIYGGTGFESANQQMPDELPERFEVGSMNITALAGLHAACEWRLENAERIASREHENAHRLQQILEDVGLEVVHRLQAMVGAREGDYASVGGSRKSKVVPYENIANIGTLRTAAAEVPAYMNLGVVSVLPPDGFSVDGFGAWLSSHNVQVRTGLHCAPSAHKELGTFPAGTVRFSTSYFTTEEDFEELEKALGR
jgi:selenocysteine lyase/cysteine desulfurase